jgi:HAE1 family hydrophobic/amphiphilic exporter-1
MKSLFSSLTTLTLRFRWVTLALALLVSIAGVVAVTQLKQELIPSVEFPQTSSLAQASGMTSEQVLDVLTARLETALGDIPEIVNIESTTTGSFGAIITARNEFGTNQERLRGKIQEALAGVWLPVREIAPAEGADPQAFATQLLGELTPDVMIYLADSDPNFLFQLSPEVWGALSDETARALPRARKHPAGGECHRQRWTGAAR